MNLGKHRRQYLSQVCTKIIRIQSNRGKEYPNFSDGNNITSVDAAWGIVERLNCKPKREMITGQAAGGLFEEVTRDFLERAFKNIQHLRPGRWSYSTKLDITQFDQYEHLGSVASIISKNRQLKSALGTDYIIAPDIVVGRWPINDREINAHSSVLSKKDNVARHTPVRAANMQKPRMILHASISCKWTVRSDRSQNARTEALNLIRNRKGRVPHIAVVTAEPLPTRIASLALGTGDVDCVYHFALNELRDTFESSKNHDQLDMLSTLVDGRRLRDISDLPLDLAS